MNSPNINFSSSDKRVISMNVGDTPATCHFLDTELKFLHRSDGPAIEWDNGDKEWWQYGRRHREDGPAITYVNDSQQWWVNGELHRKNGPAIKNANGQEEWWENGCRHRTDGPAATFFIKKSRVSPKTKIEKYYLIGEEVGILPNTKNREKYGLEITEFALSLSSPLNRKQMKNKYILVPVRELYTDRFITPPPTADSNIEEYVLEEWNRNLYYFKDKQRKILHSENKPAIYMPRIGHKEWILNGIRHREDGPALVNDYGQEEWYQHGVLHRVDGPAITELRSKGESIPSNLEIHKSYFLFGIEINKNDVKYIYNDMSKACGDVDIKSIPFEILTEICQTYVNEMDPR